MGYSFFAPSPERDLGYPYDRQSFGGKVAEHLFAEYSWHRFSVAAGIDDSKYDNWVLRGRRPPAHRDFARYIEYAIQKSGARHESRSVEHLSYSTLVKNGSYPALVGEMNLMGSSLLEASTRCRQCKTLRATNGWLTDEGSGRIFGKSTGFCKTIPILRLRLLAQGEPVLP